ncbi:hypothetical protein D9758_012103 [Tetrapyrgos nigripes]|uniref:ribonuclease H n=1 Tax=Tetrapyrgos nigripes TaxID=182062 RepID=A0A8H5CN36_9AGAR|nr:hypothetical protein D9758_012103 [Tetrapyrgos nigripes]
MPERTSRPRAGTAFSGLPAPGGVDDSSASHDSDEGNGRKNAVTVSRRVPLSDVTNQQGESAQTNPPAGSAASRPQGYLPQNSNITSINARPQHVLIDDTPGTEEHREDNIQNSLNNDDMPIRPQSRTIESEEQAPRSLDDQLMESLGMRMDEDSYELSQNRLNQLIDQIEEAVRSRAQQQDTQSQTSVPRPCTNPPRQMRRTTVRTGRRQKETKASIKVASLNIRGYGPNENLEDTKNKWNYINQFVRQKRIGVLLVQEAHMDENRRQTVQDKFSKRLVIRCSADPDSPRAKGGVAIVLNKDLVDARILDETEIIPGRALLVRMHWHKDRNLKILVVYAPNVSSSEGTKNKEFWDKLRIYFERNPNQRPDIMAGDMNVVEAGVIDRLPGRDDPEEAVDALDDFKLSTQLRDGWRDTYPDTKAYTFHQTATGSQSRIDRIYATDPILAASREWKIESTGVPGADHWMVSVLASHTDAPSIGRGRWMIPKHIIKDKTFMQYALRKGLETDVELDRVYTQGRTMDQNAQLIWHHYKTDILRVARERQRVVMPRTERQLEELRGKLQDVNNDDSLSEAERTELSSTLTSDITILERKQFQDTRKDTATRNRVEGEQISRYWSSLNKENKPRDVIYALKREDEAAEDDFGDLQNILDEWCAASTAKFNVNKTSIIPIGKEEYRRNVINTRRTVPYQYGTNPYRNVLPPNLHIAREREAVRILGAWYGNNISATQIWAPTIEKIDRVLERWAKGSPTMEGRRLITQMFAGGMSQYLTQVQGMPPEVEKRLAKRVSKYIWDEKEKNPVNKDATYLKIKEGGRAVLDIPARNEAIELMWLKRYLNFGPDRPLWAKVADSLLAANTPRSEDHIPITIKQNCFLQSWLTSSSARSTQVPELRRMISVGQKYGLRIEGLAFTRSILRAMPIWHHIQADPRIRRLTNSQASRCLMEKHKVLTVGQAEDIAAPVVSITDQSTPHQRNDRCQCRDCQELRQRDSCTHPHQCMLRAEELLDTLPQKWDPRAEQPEDYEKEPDEDVREENTEVFDYRISTNGDLSDIFRIFTDDADTSNEVLIRKIAPGNEESEKIVATDGSCTNNGQEDARAGAGVFYGHGDPTNQSIRLPKRAENVKIIQSNQAAELVAAMKATEPIAKTVRVKLETDSKYVITHLTKGLRKMEDTGYIDVNNAEIIRTMIARYRVHEAPIHVKWVKGHNGHEGNEEADTLAGMATTKLTEDQLDLTVPQNLRITGAKLKVLTQRLAYTAIRQRKSAVTPDRPRTRSIITQVKTQTRALFDISPTDSVIWASIRTKDLERKTRYFLWMVANDAYMTGTHWQRTSYTAEAQERAICQHDQKVEDIAHILTGCESPGQELVWELTGKLWDKKGTALNWERPALGTIVGAGLAVFKTPGGTRKMGEERLWRILVAESAYLIWKMRCERVIRKDNTPFTSREIENRWIHMVNERIQLDRRMTSRKYGSKGVSPNLVRATWQGLLMREHTLPDDWVTNTGVLVGIESDLRRRTGPRGR